MASDLNQCNFIGRLGKDVETRYLSNGDAVANFSIAVGWKSKDKEGTEWINVVAFQKLAEICAQYLKSGSKIFLSGKLKIEKYTDKEGVERYSTKVIADQMQMLDGKPAGADSAPRQTTPAPRQSQSKPAQNFSDMDSDIPF